MISLRRCLVGLLLVSAPALPAGAAAANPPLAQYQKHLADLDAVVAACQKQRGPEACDPALVGANDTVPWPAAASSNGREINYDWLRVLLATAAKPDGARPSPAPPAVRGGPAAPAPPTVDSLLAEARRRLHADAAQAAQPPVSASDDSAQRNALAAILARPEYQGVTQTTVRERFLEWLANLLDAILGRLMSYGARAAWIGFAFRALLVGGLCFALIWVLIRIERRSRVRLIADVPLATGAPSARDWQLWLRDAQAMAADGLWREAIHFLYWAAIARLESRRLWPADRARTPREYLRLIPASDPRREGLSALTRTFERTWYGGRPAESADYSAATKVAAELGVE